MKHTPRTPAHLLRRRPPFFHPVPLRSRRDGWTVARQCGFLAQLHLTGSVREAARRVGMSRASAYRLRARAGAEGFAQAWDHVLTPPAAGRARRAREDYRKVTLGALAARVERGLVCPLVLRGEIVAILEKPDNSALLHLLGRRVPLAARRAQNALAQGGRVHENTAFGVNKHGAAPQPMPGSAHGNGTTGPAGLTARAECGPSRQTASRGIA